MTDRVIRVVLDSSGIASGARRAGGPLQNLENRTRGLSRGFKAAAAAAGLLVGGLGIRALLRTADAYQQVQNRLRIVTDSTEELTAANERLFDIAQDTRQEFDSTVELYTRASIAAGELGASQEELFELVEITGQALAIQGGSAAEASGALRQLSQSFASGIVRAEEFNSILEGAFPIAQAAARGIDAAGGSVGKLRNLVVEGEISSREFFEAILEGGQSLESTFAQTVPTISQAVVQLQNSFQFLVGGIDTATGATGAISTAIQEFSGFLDDNREEIIAWVNTAVEGIIVGGRAIIDFFRTVDTQLAGIVTDIVGTTGVILENLGFETGTTLVEQAIGTRAEINADLAAVEADFLAFTDRLMNREQFQAEGPGAGEGGGGVVDPNAADDVNDARDAVNEFVLALENQEVVLGLQRDLGDDAAEAITRYKEELELAAAEAEIFGELQPTEEVNALREAFRTFSQEAIEGQRALREEIEAAELAETFDEQIEALEEEILLLQADNTELALNAELRALAAGATVEQAEKIRELTETLLDEKDAIADQLPTLEDFFSDVGDASTRTLSGILADPMQEGLDEIPFKFAQLLQQLAAQALAAEITDIIGGLFGGGGGGGGGGFLSFVGGLFGGGLQAGGTISSAGPRLVGERGPELFTPASSGTISPNVNIAQAAQAPPVVNVVNVSDPADVPTGIESPEGEEAVINVIQRNPETVRRLLG